MFRESGYVQPKSLQRTKHLEGGQNPDTQRWARAIQAMKAIVRTGAELRELEVLTRNVLVVYQCC